MNKQQNLCNESNFKSNKLLISLIMNHLVPFTFLGILYFIEESPPIIMESVYPFLSDCLVQDWQIVICSWHWLYCFIVLGLCSLLLILLWDKWVDVLMECLFKFSECQQFVAHRVLHLKIRSTSKLYRMEQFVIIISKFFFFEVLLLTIAAFKSVPRSI